MTSQSKRFGRRPTPVRPGRKSFQHFGWPQRLRDLNALYSRVRETLKKPATAAR